MKRLILRSTIVNDDAYDIANTNCLSEHIYLIKVYWKHNFRGDIWYNLHCVNNQISEDSIVEALTKWEE